MELRVRSLLHAMVPACTCACLFVRRIVYQTILQGLRRRMCMHKRCLLQHHTCLKCTLHKYDAGCRSSLNIHCHAHALKCKVTCVCARACVRASVLYNQRAIPCRHDRVRDTRCTPLQSEQRQRQINPRQLRVRLSTHQKLQQLGYAATLCVPICLFLWRVHAFV